MKTAVEKAPILELRVYEAAAGRIDDLLRRFRNHTFGFFQQYDIRVVVFGVSSEQPERVYYVVQWDDKVQMDRTWAAIFADPEWREMISTTDGDGRLVASVSRQVLRPIDVWVSLPTK